MYNKRRKVTSSAKKKRRHADKSLHQVQIHELFDTYPFAERHVALFLLIDLLFITNLIMLAYVVAKNLWPLRRLSLDSFPSSCLTKSSSRM